jgi:hypothetical protein
MGAIPSAKALERFLKLFHDDGQVHPGEGVAWVPEETEALKGLARINRWFVKCLIGHRIEFTVTGRLSSSIMEWIQALPEAEWKPLQMVTKDGMKESGREWAEMPWGSAQGSQADIRERVIRTVITRKKAHQWEMFKDEHVEAAEKDRYEAIATNRDWEGDRLIRWHYERGGSIEHIHDRVKNDLAGHVLPCAEFGANAAWFVRGAIFRNF